MAITKSVLSLIIMSLALTATFTNAGLFTKDVICMPVATNIHSCTDALRNVTLSPGDVTRDCCNGLRAIEDLSASLGLGTTCHCIMQCLRAHFPQVVNVTRNIAVLQSSCNVNIPC